MLLLICLERALFLVAEPCIVVSVSVGVMVSMLALWAGGSQIDTQSETFNGNDYFNGWMDIYIYATWWMTLALSVVQFTT